MTRSFLLRSAAAIAFAAGVSCLPASAAQDATPAAPAAPGPQDLARISPAGSYLAARHAGLQRDAAAAAAYYKAALRADPRNGELLERTFLSLALDGDLDEASRLAERIVQIDRTHRIARLVLGVRSIKTKQYAAARQHLALSVRGPIADLTATLLAGWAQYGAGDARAAVDAIDKLVGPDWYGIFKDLHTGLILDLAGKRREAGKRLKTPTRRTATPCAPSRPTAAGSRARARRTRR